MANAFKSNVAANIVTTGNTVYTCPALTETTVIGLSLSNKSFDTVTSNTFLRRGGVDYSIVSNAPVLPGSTLIPIGGEQKLVMNAADQLKITVSANASVDVVVSVLEIS
jgi:hypothetical protein